MGTNCFPEFGRPRGLLLSQTSSHLLGMFLGESFLLLTKGDGQVGCRVQGILLTHAIQVEVHLLHMLAVHGIQLLTRVLGMLLSYVFIFRSQTCLDRLHNGGNISSSPQAVYQGLCRLTQLSVASSQVRSQLSRPLLPITHGTEAIFIRSRTRGRSDNDGTVVHDTPLGTVGMRFFS